MSNIFTLNNNHDVCFVQAVYHYDNGMYQVESFVSDTSFTEISNIINSSECKDRHMRNQLRSKIHLICNLGKATLLDGTILQKPKGLEAELLAEFVKLIGERYIIVASDGTIAFVDFESSECISID